MTGRCERSGKWLGEEVERKERVEMSHKDIKNLDYHYI